MSKPRVDPTFGISSEDVLIPTERHPACRQREARPGSGTERENLAGDAKGKGASGYHREAESTDAPERGGLLRSSDEGSVMGLERRGPVQEVVLAPRPVGTKALAARLERPRMPVAPPAHGHPIPSTRHSVRGGRD